MKELRPGFWVPGKLGGDWLFADDPLNNLPSHSLTQIRACIKACGDRRGLAIDGGAFVGSWSVHLASAFDRVWAFEPIPENHDCLKRNVERFKNVHALPGALSDRSGWMEREAVMKSYTHRVRHVAEKVGEFVGFTIDELGLDQRLDFLKLDVESHECEALMGGRETIRRDRPVIMIEEKFDPYRRASTLLRQWGMVGRLVKKHDYLFTWP